LIQAAIEGKAFRSAGAQVASLFLDGTEKKVLCVRGTHSGRLGAISLPIPISQAESKMTLFGEMMAATVGRHPRSRKMEVISSSGVFATSLLEIGKFRFFPWTFSKITMYLQKKSV
jgi:hypothetical protein